MISATELAQLRADTEKAVLNKTGSITQRSRVQDVQGGGADNYVTVDNVPCAITSGMIRSGVVMAGQLMSLATQTILLPAETDVQVDARIKIDGSTYRVIGPSYVRAISVLLHVDALFDASLP